MSKFNKIEDNYWRNIATRTILTIITIAVIVALLPRSQSKLFNYEVGQVWRYPALNAQFDFPVFKTDEAVKAERDSVISLISITTMRLRNSRLPASVRTSRTAFPVSRVPDGWTTLPSACNISMPLA